MQIANSPLKWTIAFANGDTGRVEVPATTADPTRASLTLGFPPLTRVPPEDGGVPPLGEDFNGAMNQVARIALWNMAGGIFSYDATFANDTNISGYPQGAVLASTDFSGAWTTTVDNNAVDPDTTGTNWVPVYAYGVLALTGQTGGTTTLTPVQAMKKTITIAGALTSNLTVVVPAWTYNWQVSNLTTGAFTVTVKTAAGSGTIIPQTGTPTPVTGDGTNVASADYLRADLASSSAGKGAALVGYLGGLLKTFLDNLSVAGAATGAAMLAFIHNGTGAVGRLLQDKVRELARSPQDYGAKGDTQAITGATSITSGAAVLTITGAAFTAADVGKSITVPGAGAAGGLLTTTISVYTSATQVTLATNASTTLAAVSTTVIYGTDDTVAVQAWADACVTNGFKGTVPAVAFGYLLTSTINLLGALAILGDGCEPQVGDLGTTQVRGRGSWFYINHTGKGFVLNDPTQYRSGMEIDNIGTVRNQPVTTGGSFTPYANDFDFEVKRCDATFRSVFLYNATKGILHDTGGYGRLSVYSLRGQPLSVGIEVDDSADTCRFRDIHFWPFFSNATVVRTYMLANAKAMVLKDVDNPDISGFFTIGYSHSLSCEPATTANAMPLKVRLSNFDFDNGGYGIRIASGGSNGVTMLVSQGYVLGSSTASGSSNISIEGNNNTILIDNLGLDLPQLSNINVAGTGNKVRVGNISLDRWNYAAGAANGVTVAASNTVRFATVPIVNTAGTTNPMFSTTGTISSPLSSGQTSGTTNASGIVTLTHGAPNAPKHVDYAYVVAGGLVAKPTGTYTATTFDLEIRNITAGGALQVSYGVTVDWRVSY